MSDPLSSVPPPTPGLVPYAPVARPVPTAPPTVAPPPPEATPASAPTADPAPQESIRFNHFSRFDLFDPTAGVSFDLSARARLNVPATQLIDEAGQDSPENPLDNPLLRDYSGGVDLSTGFRMNRSNWFFGVGGDVQAALRSQGVDQNRGAFSQVYAQAEAIQEDFSGLEGTIRGLQEQLANDPALAQAQSLMQQLQANPANPQALQQLRGLLQSGAIQRSLDSLSDAIGQTNTALAGIQDAMTTLGDGTRSVLADAQVQGALEMQAGYRSDPISLGNGWHARLGVAGSVILPLPNYGQNAGIPGLSEFRYAMVKLNAQARLTTSGLDQLAGNLGVLQQNLSNLQGTLNTTRDQVDQAANIANQPIPNPAQAAGVIAGLQQSTAAAAQTGQAISDNLETLQGNIAAVEIRPSFSLSTVTPTSPIGFGIRQAGASFQGPLASWLQARADVNVYNPWGMLPGVENRYELHLNQSGNLMDSLLPAGALPDQPERGGAELDPRLEQTASIERNVFHDFYQPAIGAQIGLRAFADRWFSPELQFSLRQGFDGAAPGAEVHYTQHLGPLSLTSGVLMPDLNDMNQNFYSAEIGIADVVSLGAGTQSFSELRGLQTNLSVRLPGESLYFRGMVSPTEVQGQAGVAGFGTLGGEF